MSFIDTEESFIKKEMNLKKQISKSASYSVSDNLFQINTWNEPGHTDQTIQFDIKGIKKLIDILKCEYPEIYKDTNDIKKINISLLDKNGNPQYGLNWGQRDGRDPNQAYIQLPIDVYRSDFFPKKPQHFNVKTDDGQTLVLTRAQKTEEGTALQTPEDNSLFGKYLKNRMGIPYGEPITKQDILKYGCSKITFFKINNQFFLDFSGYSSSPASSGFEIRQSVQFSVNKNNSIYSPRYITSLLAKPFVILTGNSGTGKTRIARRFAEYLKKESESGESNILIVPVGADWTDNTKILGYFNPLADDGAGVYVKTEIFRFLERANANPQIPFFLILDEMNLSHVERYFSDFLSKMEIPGSVFEIDGYGSLPYPKNLFVTGTVNIDETTYMFSPKVLDRANVIEFKPEKDSVLTSLTAETEEDSSVAEPGMAEGFLQLAEKIRNAPATDYNNIDFTVAEPVLSELYDILQKAGFEFAFRTVKEIRQYLIAAYELEEEKENFSLNGHLDIQILQKILPKIYGNRQQVGTLLEELKVFFEKENFTHSLQKVTQMAERLSRFQFVSFV